LVALSRRRHPQGHADVCAGPVRNKIRRYLKFPNLTLYDVSFSDLPEVCRGRFDPGANLTVPSEETLMDQLLLIDSDTLFKCVKIGREHY
jgi:hypothetical protein